MARRVSSGVLSAVLLIISPRSCFVSSPFPRFIEFKWVCLSFWSDCRSDMTVCRTIISNMIICLPLFDCLRVLLPTYLSAKKHLVVAKYGVFVVCLFFVLFCFVLFFVWFCFVFGSGPKGEEVLKTQFVHPFICSFSLALLAFSGPKSALSCHKLALTDLKSDFSCLISALSVSGLWSLYHPTQASC